MPPPYDEGPTVSASRCAAASPALRAVGARRTLLRRAHLPPPAMPWAQVRGPRSRACAGQAVVRVCQRASTWVVEVVEVAAVVEDVVGDLAALGVGGLGGDPGPGVRLGEAAGHETLHPQLLRRLHDDDDVELAGAVAARPERLREQRDVVHDDRVRSGRRQQLGGALPHQRVDDRLERLPALRVREHDRGQGGAVERPVGGQHLGAELLHDRGQARCARLDDLARDRVGVDDDGAEGGQPLSDRALPRPDAPGQRDAGHGPRSGRGAMPPTSTWSRHTATPGSVPCTRMRGSSPGSWRVTVCSPLLERDLPRRSAAADLDHGVPFGQVVELHAPREAERVLVHRHGDGRPPHDVPAAGHGARIAPGELRHLPAHDADRRR